MTQWKPPPCPKPPMSILCGKGNKINRNLQRLCRCKQWIMNSEEWRMKNRGTPSALIWPFGRLPGQYCLKSTISPPWQARYEACQQSWQLSFAKQNFHPSAWADTLIIHYSLFIIHYSLLVGQSPTNSGLSSSKALAALFKNGEIVIILLSVRCHLSDTWRS